MRGRGYMRKWDRRVREAVAEGLSVSTISVVNNELLADGPEAVLDYLAELGVCEASFLPFMLNEQNLGERYERFAPPMRDYSRFKIRLAEHWYRRDARGDRLPQIGQMNHIVSHRGGPAAANVAGQTLFLLPEGDFVLPDYKAGYFEYMNAFGNILEQDFASILASPGRRAYLRRQFTRNRNPECLTCELSECCLMEFWKDNRPGDDCFGAQAFVTWLLERETRSPRLTLEAPVIF